MAAAIAGLYQAKIFANSPTVGLWDTSFADILVLGSYLAMARCEGPQVSAQYMNGYSFSRSGDSCIDSVQLTAAYKYFILLLFNSNIFIIFYLTCKIGSNVNT